MSLLVAAPLGLSLLLGPTSGPEIGLVEAAGPTLPVAPRSSLGALMGAPEQRLGEAVTVVAQLHQEIEDWDPFLSRFTPVDHRCVEVWSDEQRLWIAEEYDAPMARLHVRRGTAAEAVLASSRPHDRLELEVVVRELLAGSSWIEVTHAARTEQQTPEGTVLHAIRALEMIEREGWRIAISELDRALAPDLPGHVRRELESIREDCQETWDALRARTLR
ncbi:MAG: hypothetical protein VX460_07020 [Planctomycetota bacterium]|nr:hypothetical protein [Planctomycetota bacterium]